MNAGQINSSSFEESRPIFFSRVAYKSFLTTVLRFIGVILAITLFILVYGMMFYSLAPLQVESFTNILEFSLALYLIPSVAILVVVHLSSPALHIRGISWRYLKVYTSLFVGAGLYVMSLNLWFTNSSVLIAALIFLLISTWVFPTVRRPIIGMRASLYAFMSAVMILLSTSGSPTETRALERLQTTSTSLVQVQRNRPAGYVSKKNKVKTDESKKVHT